MKPVGMINFHNNLESTDVFSNADLNPLLKAALKKIDLPYAPGSKTEKPYWNADFFGLSALNLYSRINDEERSKILFHCNRMALEETFYIEKSGMTYAAKMALIADTNDKRALYSLFCADEASHFHAINAFMLSEPEAYAEQKFLVMLDNLVHEGSYNVLVYMIQIILEGWGLHHYRSLAAHCQHEPLAAVLRTIINDEAKHHGSGLVILPQEKWTDHDTRLCLPALQNFLNLVRVGPTNLLAALEKTLGPLSTQEKSEIFSDLNAEAEIQQNLKTLGSLIFQHCPDQSMAKIFSEGDCFKPISSFEFSHSSRG